MLAHRLQWSHQGTEYLYLEYHIVFWLLLQLLGDNAQHAEYYLQHLSSDFDWHQKATVLYLLRCAEAHHKISSGMGLINFFLVQIFLYDLA